jgi:hypothetical protein
MRRAIYWLGAILLLVLQVDFWTAPWRSQLQQAALIGSTLLGCAYIGDVVFQNRAMIWHAIQRLRK